MIAGEGKGEYSQQENKSALTIHTHKHKYYKVKPTNVETMNLKHDKKKDKNRR